MDICLDSVVVANYVEHLLELNPTIRIVLIENVDIFFRNSDKFYAKSFYKKSYIGKEISDYKSVCQMVSLLIKSCAKSNTRLVIGMSKIDIVPISIPLPRGYEFGKELKVVDPSTDELTSDIRVIEKVLNPADILLNLQGPGFIKALRKGVSEMYYFFEKVAVHTEHLSSCAFNIPQYIYEFQNHEFQ